MTSCALCEKYIKNRRRIDLSKDDIEILGSLGGTIRGLSRKEWRRYLEHGLTVCNKCFHGIERSTYEERMKANTYLQGFGKKDQEWLSKIPSKSFDTKNCVSDALLNGDSFESLQKGELIVFVHSIGKKAECYGLKELYEWWNKSERLYYWPKKDKRIYKLPYSGIWVDQEIYNLVIDEKKTAIVLKEKEKHAIGSSFGVSQTHGEIHTIYTGMAIDPDELHDLRRLAIFINRSPELLIEEEEVEFPIPDEEYESPLEELEEFERSEEMEELE